MSDFNAFASSLGNHYSSLCSLSNIIGVHPLISSVLIHFYCSLRDVLNDYTFSVVVENASLVTILV